MRRYKKDKRSLSKRKEDVLSSYWLKKADTIWSKYIRRKGICEICGATENLNAHHLIPWENKETRHNPLNGIALCPRCHKWDNLFSAHQGCIFFSNWLKNNKKEQYYFVILKTKELLKNRENKDKEYNWKDNYKTLKELLNKEL